MRLLFLFMALLSLAGDAHGGGNMPRKQPPRDLPFLGNLAAIGVATSLAAAGMTSAATTLDASRCFAYLG